MMSQQQNPSAPEMGSEKANAEADVKPFSIRQYALASRHRSIFHSWPFPEKYLHMCLNRGLRDVLPPLGPQNSPSESHKSCSNLMHSRDDSKGVEFCKAEVPNPQNIKNECGLFSDGGRYKITNHTRDCPSSSHEEGDDQHNCGVSVNVADAFSSHPSSIHVHKNSPATLAPSKKDKRRRRRGRFKKRSMVDILAVARHCTLEEIYGMNKFFYAETVIEGCQEMGPSESVSKSELKGGDEDSCRKAGREDHEVANIGITGKGTLLLKFRLNGCNVNQNCGT